jgi:hypothetical protein
MANRYWVGGTGTWDAASTTNWSATSGGSGGASVPGNNDIVIFDSLSNATSYTVTRTFTTNVQGINMAGPLTGTLTYAGSSSITITTGGLSITSTGVSWTNTGLCTFSNTCSITTNGVSLTSPITIFAFTVTLGSALTTTGTFILQSGTFALNGFNLTCNTLGSSFSNNRSIIWSGSESVNITGNAGTIISMTNATAFTYSGTPTVNSTYSGSTGTRTIVFGASSGATETNALNINISAGSGVIAVTSGSHFRNLNFTGFTGTWSPSTASATFYGNVTLVSGMTYTTATTGIWTFANTSGTAILTSGGKTVGPITLNASGGTLQLGSTFSQTTTAAFTYTAGTIDINSQTNTFGALTITTMPTITNGPLNATTVTQSSGTVTIPALSATQFTCSGAYTFTSGTINIGTNNATLSVGSFNSSNSNTRVIQFGTGNITLTGSNTTILSMATATNFTYTGTPTVNATYSGSTGTRTISFNTGATSSNVLNINITAGADIIAGQLICNDFNTTGFTGSLSNINRTFYGNVTFGSGSTTAVSAFQCLFQLVSGTQTFTPNGVTINFPIAFGSAASAGTCAISGALTTTSSVNFLGGTLQLPASTTTTVGSFTTTGTTLKYLTSSIPGTQATISDASGTNAVTYLSIQDSNATGGAFWNASGAGNVNAGNNSGWFGGSFSSANYFLLF